ncbi:nucleolar complex protein 14 [Coemansia sp. RSA 2531]|nr:nucleolar complex protein 14 [Coemansia sp. RSA 2531]
MGSSGKGAKQSALKKLRSALSTAGLTGPSAHVTKKDKKRGVAKAGSSKTIERRQKLRAIQKALNPFEMQVNRKKLDVLGLKRKDEVVNVAVARQRAVEKRKSTIGEERKNKHRTGGVVDRRIGENDPTMDPEEKMLKRFTAERQKRSSAAMYNLEDDNGDVEGEITSLTHYGQSISEMDEFNDLGGDDDDEDGTGALGGADVSTAHFGGFETAGGEGDGPARKKTKAEVMQEIIAKSKMHKQERQLIKEQDEDIRRELDDDFESVRAMLFDDDNSKPMMSAAAGDIGSSVKPNDDGGASYDSYVRELAYEQRARPQDRLKTEMEAAREEKDRLERAERHRQRRMEGLPSDSELDSDSDNDDSGKKGYKTKAKRKPVADDLGDDFAAGGGDAEMENAEATGNLGLGLTGEESDNEEESGSDEEDESGSGSGSGSDEEDDDSEVDSDQGESVLGDSSDEEEEEKERAPAVKSSSRKAVVAMAQRAPSTGQTEELPFTFAAPADYDAWIELVGDYSLEQQLTVIARLRTLYHIRLSPQNKEKLSDLCLVLTEHLAVLTEQDPPVPAPIIDGIVKHIGELASVDAERFGEHCRQAIIDCHRRVQQALKTEGESGIRASDVALMRLFASVFSSSDRFHTVITPMLILICQYLSQHTFATLRDISCGLVLVGIVHETQRLSRRLVPEALNFLFATLAATVCHAADPADWDGQYPLSRRQREAYRLLQIGVAEKCKSKKALPMRWAWLLSSSSATADESGARPAAAASPSSVMVTADVKYGILRACLQLSRRFIDSYFQLPAFIECFEPLQKLLTKISERLPKFRLQHAPAEVVDLLATTRSYLDEQLEQARSARVPLKLQYHKPLAIGSFAPKFESGYNLDVHYDPDRSRNEITKLRRQVNKERRGAVRELRRDAQFVAGERLKEQREKDKSYADKMKKAWSVLEADQSDMKKMDKARIKERKAKI